MNPPSVIWRCIITLLIFSVKRCPLLPAASQRFIDLGYLTVEPAPLFLIGSNLTVYCHIKTCNSGLKISLELNGKTVKSWRKVNCTTVRFDLVNVREPRSIVRCRQHRDQDPQVVSGLDLRGGLPPDKPDNIICETMSNSDFITCSWKREQETHFPTDYNVSISRENGTQIHFSQIQDAEEITITRGILDENTNYQLIITAYNHFGASQCDPFILCVKDIVLPEVPHIMQVEFGNSSVEAVLQWNTSESSVYIRPYIRLSTDNGPWEVREGTELTEGLIKVEDLRPLTEYQFQMRSCKSTSLLMYNNTTPSFSHGSASTRRSFCSKWSPSVRGRSPGKGLSQQLCVWRMFKDHGTNGLWDVTVLWKPPSPEDYSGEVQHYVILVGNDPKQVVTCADTLSHCAVQVPAGVQLSVRAVTSYGTSPPADVPLRHSGGFVPVLRDLGLAANGSAVTISWSWPGTKQRSTSGEDLLHYVVEWTSVPAAQLQWQTVAKDQHSTYITGLTAGVRYNICLYAVTTRGVSAPSSRLLYSKEQKPVSGPNMSVLVHKAGQILIQWDELPVELQRGFITNYTVYVQTLDYNSAELSVIVSSSSQRQIWIDCPEGALALQLTASTSAGEGPRTSWIYSGPEAPAVGLVIGIVFIITVFIAIIANLMCWSCVRKRIKQKCTTWGPAWLVENLPKPGNSNAIRLLERDGSEPSFSCTHSDPPLSPISLISWEERDDVYPTIHVEIPQFYSERRTPETPLLKSDCGTMLANSQLEHVSYKPQIALLASQGEEVKETEEEQRDISMNMEEDRCSTVFGGLLGGLLSSVEVDFSDSPLGLTLSSVGGLSWSKTSPALNRGVLPGRRRVENDAEAASLSLRVQQGEITTPDMSGACTSQYTVGTTLPYGYFPQVAADSSTTVCNTHEQQ